MAMDIVIKGAGPNSNVEQQVDSLFNASRTSLRPVDHILNGQQGGQFRVSAITGAVAGAIATNGQIFSLRWADPNKLLVVFQILASGKCEAFSTGIGVDLEVIRATNFTVSASGGTAIVPSSVGNMMRTGVMKASSFATTGTMQVATTAALTAGTQTLDTVGIGNGMFGATAAGGGGQVELFRHLPGNDHPLVLNMNEGFAIRSTNGIAASNTWRFAITLVMAELYAY